MARKSKGGAKRTKVEITPADYRFPGETNLYVGGFIAITILFVWIVAMFLIFKKTAAQTMQWQWVYLFLWPLGSIWLASFLSARKRQAQIKKAGRSARVMTNNNPGLFSILSQQASFFGFKKVPALYVLDDDAVFIYSLPGNPGSVLTSRKLVNELTQEEFSALLARELASLRARNVRLGLAITWVRNANPLLKILCLPVFLLSIFTGAWIDITDYTADRGAVLATGSEALLNLALVKQLIAQDPQAEISQADLEAFLQGTDGLFADSAQLERQFKVGTFMESQRQLKERIEQIGEYRQSDQGKRAFEKVAQIRGEAPRPA